MKEQELKEIIANGLKEAIKENPNFDVETTFFDSDFGKLVVRLFENHPGLEEKLNEIALKNGKDYMNKYLGEIMESTGFYQMYEDGYVSRVLYCQV